MATPLKDSYDRALVERIAAAATAASGSLDRSSFVDAVTDGLDGLELKDRVSHTADTLFAHLGSSIEIAAPTLVEMAAIVAGHPDGSQAWGTSMEAWPMCSVLERHGVGHPEISLAAMPSLTMAFSCEFAIRPFLTEHLDLTVESCRSWTASPVPAVRRLASEGTRPYLPWGLRVPALVADPEIGIELLQLLHHDDDEAVRRSVANHLNDIARHAPDRAAALAAEWASEPETDPSLLRHGVRSLVKQGHPGALAALGLTTEPEVRIDTFAVQPTTIGLGESIRLDVSLTSTASTAQRLVVDFVIHHVRADGSSSPKVFKWTTIDLGPGETRQLSKRRRIATASARRYHAGVHRLELQLAGTRVAESAFELTESS